MTPSLAEGQDYDGTDGGGRARIGVAYGPSLDNMTVHPDFLIQGTPNSADERSVFPNGAVVLDNGTVAMTYAGQNNGDQWGGIFLATSDCPVGCPWKKHGAVLHCGAGASPVLCVSTVLGETLLTATFFGGRKKKKRSPKKKGSSHKNNR